MRKEKNKDDGLTTATYVLAGVLLAFGINYGMGFALATNYPIVAVESNSMVPTFARGDILLVKGIPPQDLKVGDTIVFSVPGKPVPIVHRIVSINSDGTYQTKGDANSGQHPWETSISANQIKGKEIFILPLFGWVKIAITELVIPNILLIALAGVTITFIYLQTNKKERIKFKRKRK